MADFEELKNELIKSYQDLLELQYHEKPKAREHIKTICESLIADMVLWKIQEKAGYWRTKCLLWDKKKSDMGPIFVR